MDQHRQRKRRHVFAVVTGTIIVIVIYCFYTSTGIFQPSRLDDRDINAWSRTGEFITGSEGFTYSGKNETCWLLIHSYGASPAEMRELAEEIYTKFGDTVVGIRLEGHGELPSKIEDKNLTIWYAQVESEIQEGMRLCNNLNVVGSSLGAVLALRLAEDYELKNLYVVNPFLTKTFAWYKIFPFEVRLRFLSPLFRYDKKTKVANINDPSGLQEHIAYWNLPYAPLRASLPFIKETRQRLAAITEPTFIAYALGDTVAAPSGAEEIYSNIASGKKELFSLNRSNHVLLMDYEREDVIQKLIAFEERSR